VAFYSYLRLLVVLKVRKRDPFFVKHFKWCLKSANRKKLNIRKTIIVEVEKRSLADYEGKPQVTYGKFFCAEEGI
jgi:hypothetical protein